MQITLNSPFDAHLHLRDDDFLKMTVPATAETFSSAVVMPNLKPPLTTPKLINEYKNRIVQYCDNKFDPKIAFFLTKDLQEKDFKKLKNVAIVAKLYPAGVTTNSDGGVSGFDSPEFLRQLEILEDLEIPLSIHGETNGFVLSREAEFATLYKMVAKRYPKLKIIMEHISSKELTNLIDEYENIYATVTVHHLLYTLDELIGGGFNPHFFCKPIVKTPQDREAIIKLVLSGNKKVMFGSDSAPHLRVNKECKNGAAGVFTAPIALIKLAQFFEKHHSLDLMQNFVSTNAIKNYNLEIPKKIVTLEKSNFIVPDEYEGVVPMCSGETISWMVKKVE